MSTASVAAIPLHTTPARGVPAKDGSAPRRPAGAARHLTPVEAEVEQVEPTAVDSSVAPERPATAPSATESSGIDASASPDATDAWQLVSSAQQGDATAFGELYDRYVSVVFRYVLFRLGDRDLAEDVTSETFLRALRRISSVTYQGRDVGAWFVTIARNLVLDHVKSSRFRLEVATAEVDDPGTVHDGPEQQVLAGLTKAELLGCIAQLGADQQECITLRFLQGLSVAETAEVMGRNDGAIKALQHRAVRRLAQLLPGHTLG